VVFSSLSSASRLVAMVETRPRRKPLVLASTQALLDSLPGERRVTPPLEPVRLRAGVLRFPSRAPGGAEFGDLASFVALTSSALRRLAVVTGTPVRRPFYLMKTDGLVRIRWRRWTIRLLKGSLSADEIMPVALRSRLGFMEIWLFIELDAVLVTFGDELD
jgi:hypothetical protein